MLKNWLKIVSIHLHISIIWLWETWLTKHWRLSQEEEKTTLSKYGIDLYLQQEQDVSPTKTWVIKADEFNKRCKEQKLPYGLRVWGKKSGRQAVCFTESKNREFCHRFILDRHRDFALSSDDPPGKNDNYVILDKSNTDFEALFRPSFTDIGPFTLPYELLEAGLLRILVLDERIAQKSMSPLTDTESSKGTVKKVLMDEEDYSPVFWHMAIKANIFVATHLIFKKADDVQEKRRFKLAEDAYETSLATFRNEEKSSAGKQSCPSLKLVVDTSTSPASIQVEEEKIGPEIKKISKNLSDFDMVIIHQGILDRINQQINTGEDFLDQLEKNIPWLVIESGRGIPPNLSKYHKFVPFSIIERAFHRERIAKLGLTGTLMELSRNK